MRCTWHVIRTPFKFESTMEFKQSSLRAAPHVRTKWSVYQVGSDDHPTRALLEILPVTPAGMRYFKLLHTIYHRNILGGLVVNAGPQFEKDGQNWLPIFVFYMEGTPYDFCGPESSCLVGAGNLVPSSLLVEIARNIIDGLSFLHTKGEYHGNISIGTMFYYHYRSGRISVQLANFGYKEIPLKEAQRDDWHDFGKLLLEIEQEVSAYNSCHTSILMDFANLFTNITEEDLCTIKQKAYKHTFFSDASHRRSIIRDVSDMLDRPEFCELLCANSSKICSIPWGCADYYALLPAVNQCRQMDFDLMLYEEDFNDVMKFVSFIEDLYTHCRKIDVPEPYDAKICRADLCWTMGYESSFHLCLLAARTIGGSKYTTARMDEFVISKHPRLHHELQKLVMEFTSSEASSSKN